MYSYQIHAYTMHEYVSDKHMSKVLYLQVCHAEVGSSVHAYLVSSRQTTDAHLRYAASIEHLQNLPALRL